MAARLGKLTRFALLALLLPVAPAQAQWNPNGVAVCTSTGVQHSPIAISDGNGGVIIAWEDERGTFTNVYAQRLNSAGVRMWSSGGVLVTSIFNAQRAPAMVGDGLGGAIIAWGEIRTAGYDLYGQRLDPNGARLWGSGGIAISQATGNQYAPAMVHDGRSIINFANGAIVAWQDERSTPNSDDVYAQAVGSDGSFGWTTNGIPVCTAQGMQFNVGIVTDGTGAIFSRKGVIIAWNDLRNGAQNADIYAQRLNSAGAPQLGTNGIAVSVASGYQLMQGSLGGAFIGGGNAILAWHDPRPGAGNGDIYANRVGTSGSWLADGLPIAQATDMQDQATIISYGATGAILAWRDKRAAPDSTDIYAQRIDGNGSALLTPGGVPLCTAMGAQSEPRLVLGGDGSVIAVWEDRRTGGVSDIYTQRLEQNGAVSWAPNGLPVCLASGSKTQPALVQDNVGTAIVVWTDRRGADPDIYANRLVGGVVGVEPTDVERLRMHAPFPNPTPGTVSIRFELPTSRQVSAEVFGLDGRLVRTLAEKEEFTAGVGTLNWDGRAATGKLAGNGVYFVRVRAGAESEVRKILLMP